MNLELELLESVKRTDIERAEKLLGEGRSSGIPDFTGIKSKALHEAIIIGNKKMIELLVRNIGRRDLHDALSKTENAIKELIDHAKEHRSMHEALCRLRSQGIELEI